MAKRSFRRFPNLVCGPAWPRPAEAGYTSAVVTIEPDPVDLLQSGGVHVRPHMTQSGHEQLRITLQPDLNPISPVVNPCCNPGLNTGVVLELRDGDATTLQSKQRAKPKDESAEAGQSVIHCL